MNRLTVLDKAPYFDVCKCLPHDIMHVILEGVLPLSCKLLLIHCIFDEHYFTLKVLNQRIAEFEYGYSESKNVPRQLDNDHLRSPESKFNQSGMMSILNVLMMSAQCFSPASQMWLLGRLLPSIVGKHVPDDDAHWRCYLQLLRIVTIATAIEVTEDTVSNLSLLIRDYLVTFNSLYPSIFTPKLHYLLHLPRQMQL